MKVKRTHSRKAIWLTILLLYLGVIAGATIYAQTGYLANLPAVRLARPAQKEIPYELHAPAVVEDGRIVCRCPYGSGIPGDVIFPGQEAAVTGSLGQTGTALVESQEGTVYERGGITFFLEIIRGDFSEGETVEVVIPGRTKSYPDAVPRSAIHYNERQEVCLYTVEAQDGPWGMRFLLKEQIVGTVWPPDNDSEYVVPSALLGDIPVVVGFSGDRAYSGAEVRLVDEGGNEG